jgi:hypothetical protein
VDCINQAVIIQTLFVPTLLIPPYAITEINKQAKKVKSFERDLFFVETLLNNPMQIVKARSILEGEKSKLWVPAWNRCITIHGEVPSGKDLSLSIYINPSKRNWKRKIVVEIRHSLGKN